jgi:hypothetical protein
LDLYFQSWRNNCENSLIELILEEMKGPWRGEAAGGAHTYWPGLAGWDCPGVTGTSEQGGEQLPVRWRRKNE